jgi:hypothetical protein
MLVTFQALPGANAGPDQTICDGSTASLAGSITNSGSSIWTTAGDGIFDSPASLTATYTPGSVDITAGSVVLTLTSNPITPCTTPASDSLTVTIDSSPNVLELRIDEDGLCLEPDELVNVTLAMRCLDSPVAGYQVFLSFDPALLDFVSGTYILPDPFGIPLISPINAASGNIDLAAGINVIAGQPPTASDAVLASLQFRARHAIGSAPISFRTNTPPNSFSDTTGGSIEPTTVNSPDIEVSSTCGPCPAANGDMDADGVTNGRDLQQFFEAILAGSTSPADVCPGDFSANGVMDLDDIPGMVSALLSAP